MTSLVGIVFICVYALLESHAAMYPGAVDQPPGNSGAPSDMSPGWSPSTETQAQARYLQTQRNNINQASLQSTTSPALLQPGTSGTALAAWLKTQISRLLPLHYLLQPSPSSTTNQQQLSQQPPTSLQLPQLPPQMPLHMPAHMPPQMPPQPPQDQSPFGPQLPYNPQTPNQQYHAPPPQFMPMPGRSECSGFSPGSLCCDGIFNPLPPGGLTQWACCHKGMYNIRTQVCCGDIPVPKPMSGPPLMCCGTMLYDPATHLCCGDFPVPNPSGTLKCCRKTTYNPATQMCCAESLRPRSPSNMHLDCCGKHLYDPRTHMCCDEGNSILKNPSTQCCGKKFFQPAFQQCCFGDPLPRDAFCMAK